MKKIRVGIAEMAVAQGDVILQAVGLGSCVAVALYDEVMTLGGMVHPLLPSSNGYHSNVPSLKFMDVAIAQLLKEMELRGCLRNRIIAKAAGGAVIFPMRKIANIGTLNSQMALRILEKHNIKIAGFDFGGDTGRTVEFYVSSGKMVVKNVKGKIITL